MTAVRLSDAQERALRALADGPKWRSYKTMHQLVQGRCALALIALGFAHEAIRYGMNTPTVAITAAGREWLAQHDKGGK